VDKEINDVVMELRHVFEQAGNASNAAAMRKYMKNHFDYHGIKKPLRVEIQQPFLAVCSKLNFEQMDPLIRELWQQPEREYQYLAIQILDKAKVWKTKKSIELLEWLLVNKSWWDSVDAIAVKLIGPYMKTFPGKRNLYMNKWRNSDNMWLQRTTLIFQLKYGEAIDKKLLFEIIEQFSTSKEFFLKKAIGWALRELSYYDPQEVIEFCNTHTLQALSVREAYKAMRRTSAASLSK